MYQEGTDRLLLSARRDGDQYLISQYEDFPLLADSKDMHSHSFAKLICQPTNSSVHLLHHNQCRHCDNKLGKFSCGTHTNQREVLLRVQYVSFYFIFEFYF